MSSAPPKSWRPILATALEFDRVQISYGHIPAVRGVSLAAPAGQVVALLGANGAGKSTLLRAASGILTPSSGHIYLNGTDITGTPPHLVARMGLAHVLEGRGMVVPLSVEENLMVAARAAGSANQTEALRRLDEVYTIFPRLRERRYVASGLLSGGEQQMVAIGRSLMAKPSVLMMDEPGMGLAPKVIDEIYELLRPGALIREGRTIVLAEQSANLALAVADYAYVLAKGEVVAQGVTAELLGNPAIAEAYLGVIPSDGATSRANETF
jgi:branched-chain amino acid transport system ATP-binding protein